MTIKNKNIVFPLQRFPLRVLILQSKRGYTETHTKREAVSAVSRPGIAEALFQNALKQRVSTIYVAFYRGPKICNGKTNGFFTFFAFVAVSHKDSH